MPLLEYVPAAVSVSRIGPGDRSRTQWGVHLPVHPTTPVPRLPRSIEFRAWGQGMPHQLHHDPTLGLARRNRSESAMRPHRGHHRLPPPDELTHLRTPEIEQPYEEEGP